MLRTYADCRQVNPTTTPPSTSWTHPGMAPGQVHSEQIETHREADTLYQQDAGAAGGGQTGERGFMSNAAVGTVGYKVLGSLLKRNGHNIVGGGGWGAALGMGAAGAGGVALLGKLFGVSTSSSTKTTRETES